MKKLLFFLLICVESKSQLRTNIIPIANGGTGSTSASGAKTSLSLNNVENTALSTWAGSSNLTTIGTATSGSVPGAFNNIQVLTSGTTYTPTAGTKTIILYMVGGGGGGAGGAAGSSAIGLGGGGGSGGLLIKLVTGVTGTYTYAIGTAGGGGSGGANGSNGGNTTFTNGGTTYTALAGQGGVFLASGTSNVTVLGGAGGTVSTNGDMNSGGEAGEFGLRISGTVGQSGRGGSSYFGTGGNGVNTSVNGNDGIGFGSGGSGALKSGTGSTTTGGAGKAGIIVVYEFK